MAPIKLEDNMKERLEERTIEPTMAAWDRISSKLDAEQGVQKSKRVLWMSIAASFVGGALVALFLFQNMNTDTAPVLVDTNENPVFIDPTEEIITPKENEVENLQQIKEAIVLEQEAIENEKSTVKTTTSSQNTSLEKNEVVVQGSQQNKNSLESNLEKKAMTEEVVIAETESKEMKSRVDVKEDKAFAKAKTEDIVVAQAEDKSSVTDAEIEALLKNAQREIISKQTFNQKTNTVDANALLLDVEAEVAPTSFRNKIFEAVIEGFERTKDAVVNRNN
ncbi:hypothetical protein [uncultured Dokdonia sp.]|uniref:hypothetical protein n=1 Tax=uncultured Dokdonia sp. TaxID=575653 RepID=UPI002626A588|nr:hypothetical protein [uncultured Dokdonia sp.]